MVPSMQPLLARQAVEMYRILQPVPARKASLERTVAALLDMPTLPSAVGVQQEVVAVLGPASGRVFARGVVIRVGGQTPTGQPATLPSARPGPAPSSYRSEPPAPGGLLDAWR